MSRVETCSHLNEVIDEHEGTTICIDCGLVISDKIFIYDDKYVQKKDNEICKEILARLNLSENIADEIKLEKKHNLSTIASQLYLTINKNSTISMKEIASATGVCEKQLNKKTKGNVTILDKEKLLEKHCLYLNISYKTYTVIKEMLYKIKISGHNPLTIIASCIYIYCKKNAHKLSMKKIAHTVGISCISIQRFLKTYQNELSYWC